MTIPTRKRVGGIKKGNTITASPFLMDIVNEVNRGLDDLKAPRQVENVLIEGEEEVDKLFIRCNIIEEQVWSLLCLTPADVIVEVGKPFHLRGWLATRTVNGEEQKIIPPYGLGEHIVAIRASDTDGEFALQSDNNQNSEYLDLNVDGRGWAEIA